MRNNELKKGTEIEVVLENNNPSVERDSVAGVYEGMQKVGKTNYLVLYRPTKPRTTSYIAQRTIKVIHRYQRQPFTKLV